MFIVLFISFLEEQGWKRPLDTSERKTERRETEREREREREKDRKREREKDREKERERETVKNNTHLFSLRQR